MPQNVKTLIAVPSVPEWKILFPRIPFSKTVKSPYPWNRFFDAACVGIGLVGFAGNLAKLISENRYGCILLVGIAGALPQSGLSTGDIVRVDEECVGDEGYLNGEDFVPYFRKPNLFFASSAKSAPKSIAELPGVRGVSVNTLTANSQILECRARFFGAKVESMEGASAFALAKAFGIESFEIRTISNFTGDTDESRWNIRESLRSLKQKVLIPLIENPR